MERYGEKSRLSCNSAANVYVIDDDPSVRNALVRFLLANGIGALGFDTAEAFLAQLPRLSPGSLIVDVQLPGMSGLDLLARLAGDGVRWPAVAISGAHEGNEAAASAMLGPDRYLRKPLDPKILLQVLGPGDSGP